MTRQVVIESFGNPEETLESGSHEYLIYRTRGFFIGFNEGAVDTYGDLKNGIVEMVPDPVAGTEWQQVEKDSGVACVRA